VDALLGMIGRVWAEVVDVHTVWWPGIVRVNDAALGITSSNSGWFKEALVLNTVYEH
jgi:hypothetical protein